MKRYLWSTHQLHFKIFFYWGNAMAMLQNNSNSMFLLMKWIKLFALYYIIRIKAFRSWSLWKKCLKPSSFTIYTTIQMIFSYNFSLFTYFFLLIYGDCCSWRPRAWRQVSWWHDDVRWLMLGPGLVLCSAPSVPQPVVQSRRRPLLGPSPGWKRLLALSHLRHY